MGKTINQAPLINISNEYDGSKITDSIIRILKAVSKYETSDPVAIAALEVIESEAMTPITVQNCTFHQTEKESQND